MYKPELLLPAGSLETFFAAVDGGADAIYLGFKKFNARNRAKNFSNGDIYNIIIEAHKRKKKVYITLNTLIKNAEFPELIDTLNIISQVGPDAVIVQDFATILLIRKYFKNLKIHTSTQMSSHNTLAAEFFKNHGVERIILSRELTESELRKTVANSVLPVETFVHGALCYSFSGHCLFSSYLGGNSANRGMCAQVCRRNFKSENQNHASYREHASKSALFSLKDFQLIDFIPLYSQLKVASLKVEGRMKNAEYVYNTARAYRIAIDDHARIEEAREILKFDFAREKTSWFMSGKLQDSIAENSGTGIFVGRIELVDNSGFIINSETELKPNYQLRIRNTKDTEALFIKINSISGDNPTLKIGCETNGISSGDEVYLSGTDLYKPKSSFPDYQKINFRVLNQKQALAIKSSFPLAVSKNNRAQLFIRLKGIEQVSELRNNDFESVFLKLTYSEMGKLVQLNLPATLKSKIRIELPKYISELRLKSLRTLISSLFAAGYRSFVISHISQISLLPNACKISTNENIFLLNDLSISFVQQLGIKDYCYPLENDYPNMLQGRDRNGIIPVYFHPELFYSRMPVKSGKVLADETGKKYNKSIQNGFTIITDTLAVSLSHSISKFKSKGFYRFLIDFSHEKDLSKLPTVIKAVNESTKLHGTGDFNMKKELH
jgi:putative protease